MKRLTEYVTENCSKPFYRFRSDGEIDIRYRYCINIEKAIDKLAEYENTGLEPKEVEQLKSELEELKKNVIVQKFKVGDVIWIIKRIKKEVANGKIIKQYSYFNGGTPENLRNVNRWRIRLKNNSEVTKKEYELFYTREEAEEALKKLEEK